MQIRGVAHPPPPRDGSRVDPSDLTAAEIATTNISGKPLLHEHDGGSRVGTCLASWEGRDGSLRIAAEVDHPATQQQIINGTLRGLSLGTDMVTNPDGDVLFRGQAELSVCGEGRRDRTWCEPLTRTLHSHNTHTHTPRTCTASGQNCPPHLSVRVLWHVLSTFASSG